MGLLRERLGSLGKLIVILVVLAIPTAGVWYGFHRVWKSVEEDNPYPLDPAEATRQFWTSIQNEADEVYPGAYGLLGSQTKAAQIAGLSSRGEVADHFDRIRRYLVQRVGPDFLATMQIDPDQPGAATFGNEITLHLAFKAVQGLEGKKHYAVDQVFEFPHDTAPRFAARDREIARASGEEPRLTIDRPEDLALLQHRPAVADVCRAFRGADQLDTRHALLEYILYYYPDEPYVCLFLQQDVLRSDTPAALLRIAESYKARHCQ
ncbi:MAG: hypothetical protein JW741_06690 [Sedimentisphaerales bacterium]|nr:hypothetical protein [Sedimentisphaerales bacterium]